MTYLGCHQLFSTFTSFNGQTYESADFVINTEEIELACKVLGNGNMTKSFDYRRGSFNLTRQEYNTLIAAIEALEIEKVILQSDKRKTNRL